MADRGDQTVIRRTIIERGYRSSSDNPAGGRASAEAMRNFAHQHEEEKREMQELNTKFGAYLDRVKFLETQNRKLQAQLDDLKQKWGFDSGKVKDQYDQALVSLRKQIDDVTRDKALAELRAKRAEYDASLIKHQTDFANELVNLDKNRFAMLKQQLEGSGSELDALRGRYEDKKQEIERSKNEVKRLLEQLENLKNEFDSESMARVMIQNELQTLEEQLAFMKAVHEEERNELASLGSLPIDVSQFYRTELTRAIADIKNDFEALSQAQRRELEEYYRIKTEEIREQAAEQKRKIEDARRSGAVEVMDLSSLKSLLSENRDNYAQLQKEYSDLSNHLRQLEEDFERISGEHNRAQNERDRELADLRAQAEQREQAIAAVLENNVSLRFEINTYRRLLEVEETHLQRVEGGEGLVTGGGRGSSSYHYQSGSSVGGGGGGGGSSVRFDNQSADVSTKKMTVQKSARGPIAIDQVDPQGNFIVIENAGSTGKDQDMKGWTLRRKIDSKDDIVYKFPDNFVLKSRSRIRILSRNASKGSINEKETLVAEGVQTWGTGTNMVTRLLDANGDEKALFNQKFQ
jgi:predicted  nucleic acid-binding Zn-ribbon protein